MADDTVNTLRAQVEKCEQVHELARDGVEHAAAHLTHHHRRVQALDADLAKADRAREAHLVEHPKGLEAIRTKRRQIVQQRDDLVEEMVLLEARVVEAQRNEMVALATLHTAIRRRCQAEGSIISAGMRTTISELEQGFDKWLWWARSDQQSRDTLLGITPPSDNSIPTYSWSTALDGTFGEVIRAVIHEKDRAESELRVRERAAVAVG